MSATIDLVKLPKDFRLKIEDIHEEFREDVRDIDAINKALQKFLFGFGSIKRGDDYFYTISSSIPKKYKIKSIYMGAWEDAIINITEEDSKKINEI